MGAPIDERRWTYIKDLGMWSVRHRTATMLEATPYECLHEQAHTIRLTDDPKNGWREWHEVLAGAVPVTAQFTARVKWDVVDNALRALRCETDMPGVGSDDEPEQVTLMCEAFDLSWQVTRMAADIVIGQQGGSMRVREAVKALVGTRPTI